jgi:putative transposase
MGRPHRAAEGGFVYHVLNRANARLSIFDDDGDYEAFERVLLQAVERTETRLLAYCLMPNHWHLVVWPWEDGELSRFVGWLTLTHTQRWHAHRHSAGCGHVYQGRFKSFPIQQDEHLYSVGRYVERNALRANLVRAEQWRWGSLFRWQRSSAVDYLKPLSTPTAVATKKAQG